MSTVARKHANCQAVTELHNGDSFEQKEFHILYESMPEAFKAELVNGTVYVAEPLAQPHGQAHAGLIAILVAYEASTPGVQVCDNATVILSQKDEVQPDAFLRVLPECLGRSKDAFNAGNGPYVLGAPELVAEVANSSRSIDLHLKKKLYLRSGVLEYLVICLQPREILWFDLIGRRKLRADDAGITRSKVFPGLWIDNRALISLDYRQSMKVLAEGLLSTEHSSFVDQLAKARD